MNSDQTQTSPAIHWSLGWLCAALAVVAVLAVLPFVGMGVNDDFSYTQIALALAETGRLIYNGWNTPMIGVQAYWAALLIKLFGFSFDTVRLSTLPFVAGCSLLLYYLARRMGTSLFKACLVSCFVMLSPLTIPLSASFMTDIPALCFLLFCFVATLKAIDSIATWRVWLWLCILVVSGVLGGTVRQIVWLAPIFLLPLVALRFPSWPARLRIPLLWVLTVACVYSLTKWFSAQPYAVPLSLIPAQRARVGAILMNLSGLYLECSILFIPLMILYLAQVRNVSRRAGIWILLVAVGLPLGLFINQRFHPAAKLIAFDYFDGNIITQFGILASNIEAIGQKPIVMPPVLQLLLIAIAVGLQLLVLSDLIAKTKLIPFFRERNLVGRTFGWLNENKSPVILTQILLFFTIPYLGTVLSRGLLALAIDRYLLPLLAIGSLMLLCLKTGEFRYSKAVASVCVAIFALYGIATTHDYFSCSRARVTAANQLMSRKVRDAQITAGLEFDGWTQISLTNYINDSRITVPPKAFVPQVERKYALSKPYWFWSFTPGLEPKYFVVLSPQDQLAESEVPPVPYTAWLPPHNRYVFIEVEKPANGGASALPIAR